MIVNPFSETMDMAQVYSLNETAAWLWKQLENKEFTVDEAGALLCNEYEVNNFYAVLKRQEMLDKEVYDIVHRNEKLAAPSAGKTGRKDRASGKDKEKAVPRR